MDEQAPQTQVAASESDTISPPELITETPKRIKWIRRIIFFIGVLGVTIAIIVGLIIFGLIKLYDQIPEADGKVTTFLTQVSDGEYRDAYDSTASGFKAAMTYENFVYMMDYYEAQYKGFKSQKRTATNWEKYAGQPEALTYECDITYDNGDKGKCAAVFLKEDDEWKLYGIEVTVTFDRLKLFDQDVEDAVLGIQTLIND